MVRLRANSARRSIVLLPLHEKLVQRLLVASRVLQIQSLPVKKGVLLRNLSEDVSWFRETIELARNHHMNRLRSLIHMPCLECILDRAQHIDRQGRAFVRSVSGCQCVVQQFHSANVLLQRTI